MKYSVRSVVIMTLLFCVAVNAQDPTKAPTTPKPSGGEPKKTDAEKAAKADKALKGVSQGLKAGGLLGPSTIVGSVGSGIGGGTAGSPGTGAGKRTKRHAIVL